MPGRGGGRSKSGGGGRPPPSREETISKAMSYVLRHGAEKERLKLDDSGYINCEDLLNWHRLRSLHVTFPELQNIVETNAKKRFALIPSPSYSSSSDQPSLKPSDYLIRASQGHSIAIASENLLTPLSPEDPACPDEVVHGTDENSWRAIKKSKGLKRMGRRHVHFAMGLPGGKGVSKTTGSGSIETFAPTGIDSEGKNSVADVSTITIDSSTPQPSKSEADQEQVISGMRASADTLIWVDVKRSAAEGGLKWWKSANGVVLTEGDEKGVVALKWVTRVEKRGTGEVIYRPPEAGKENGEK
ncbi:MAG: hypothetical protein Q9209_002030 [Squamulea sp. 1 TL-2023]